MENSSSEAYQIGQSIGEALGSAVIFFWIILIVIGAMFLALLVWFIWIMTRIKQESVKTNKLLSDISKGISRIGASKSSVSEISPTDELTKYKTLLDAGAISKDEYEFKKTQILSRGVTSFEDISSK